MSATFKTSRVSFAKSSTINHRPPWCQTFWPSKQRLRDPNEFLKRTNHSHAQALDSSFLHFTCSPFFSASWFYKTITNSKDGAKLSASSSTIPDPGPTKALRKLAVFFLQIISIWKQKEPFRQTNITKTARALHIASIPTQLPQLKKYAVLDFSLDLNLALITQTRLTQALR
jgi:hypothetical protein